MRAILVVLLLLLATPAKSDFTGNDWIKLCNEDDAACINWTMGVVSGFNYHHWLTNKKAAICFPNDATLNDAIGIIAGWFRDHPEQRTKSATPSVVLALVWAWPCTKATVPTPRKRPTVSTPPPPPASPEKKPNHIEQFRELDERKKSLPQPIPPATDPIWKHLNPA